MIRIAAKLLLAFTLAATSLPAATQSGVFQFENEEQSRLYQKLTRELRCLVCQNQNLADSNADLAKDLRRKTYEKILQGQDYDEIVGYMVERYGDFVIYRPPLNITTVVLWFAPFALMIAIITVAFVRIRRSAGAGNIAYSEQELERAERLMENDPRS